MIEPEMDSDLLDFSSEDDDAWLLQNLPNEDVSLLANTSTGSKNSYFNGSPLQIPRSNHPLPVRLPLSPIGEVRDNKNMEQLSPSNITESCDKENISGNKVDLCRLSVERQQMKRKKKTAGFNLRKSLAWDRAFFTEEGVLDSVELSIITGKDCQTGADVLPTIQKERGESILASNCSGNSPGLRSIEENLFKGLPVNSKNKEKKVVGGVLLKKASPSKVLSSAAQRKLLSAHDARSSSKSSGCPRPPASVSLKRPANAHMGKAQNKELRVSKVSVSRSDPLKVTNTAKKATQAPSKVKQIWSAQSIGSSQKSLGCTSSSKKTSSAQIKTKSTLATLSSIPKPLVKQARRNVISTGLDIPSESNSQHSVAVKSHDSLMTTSDLALPVHSQGSNFHDSSLSSIAVSAPQSSCRSIESAVSRLPRPSGLRMPSPSIGFFNQSKYSSQGSLEKSSQALPRSDSASNHYLIPTFKKSQAAGKVPRVDTRITTGYVSSLGSTTGYAAPSRPLQPSQEKMNVESKSSLEMEHRLQCNPISSPITKSLKHPSVTPDDAETIPLDNAAPCKYEKIFSENFEELQRQSKMSPLCSKNNEQADKSPDFKRDDIRKTCITEDHNALLLIHGPLFEDSVDSQVQCSSNDELKAFENNSQVKVSHQREEYTCKTNDFDGLCVQRQHLNTYLLPGNEDEVAICLSGEKDMLVVDHSTKSVENQLRVSDSSAAQPAFLEAFAPTESNVDDLSALRKLSGNAESVSISSGCVEVQDTIKSPYTHHKENMESDFIQCGHDMVHGGHDVTLLEKTNKVGDKIEADLVDTFPDCREQVCESEDQHFLCQLVPEAKGDHEIDVMTRNAKTDEDDGPEMDVGCHTYSSVSEQNMEHVNLPTPFTQSEDQHFPCQIVPEMKQGHEIDITTKNEAVDDDNGHVIDLECLTGSVSEQNIEQVNVPMLFSPEVIMEDQNLKPSLEPVPGRLTSEGYMQSNSCETANKFEGVGLPIEQTDQRGPSDGCSSANEVVEAVVSCLKEQPEINSLQQCIDLVIETEQSGDNNELSVMGILKEEILEVETTHTAFSMSEKTKALETDLKSSSTSTLGDASNALGTELNNSATFNSVDLLPLSKDTDLSRMDECIPKKESDAGSVELYECVEKAELRTTITDRSGKESCAQVTDEELDSHKEEEVRVVRNSLHSETFATQEEELGTLVSTDKAVLVEDIVQPNEFIVLNADTIISENNGADASDRSCNPKAETWKESNTCYSEDTDKMIIQDFKLEKRPDPLIVKPSLNATPFSEEWLAAIEAAGEEILALKTGPVQHSPPEKPAHEPSPWSPVKRKNNQGVGPYDCTKFTNKGLPPPTSD